MKYKMEYKRWDGDFIFALFTTPPDIKLCPRCNKVKDNYSYKVVLGSSPVGFRSPPNLDEDLCLIWNLFEIFVKIGLIVSDFNLGKLTLEPKGLVSGETSIHHWPPLAIEKSLES